MTTDFSTYAGRSTEEPSQLDRLILAITEQTKAINALIEQNQMLIQTMAGEEGVEEADRYQTL
jgi:hypothetical protein